MPRSKIKNNIQSTSINIPSKKPGMIHYSYIVLFFIAFVLGIVSILIFKNYINAETINFSTLDLVNLIFSIGLSASSIVLAITAIILSKNSEHVIIRQSTESKDLQNEIFTKTIGVLGKIESSTGINEKRIDDISKAVVNLPRHTGADKGEREDKIKKIMRENLLTSDNRNVQRIRKEKLEIEHEKKKEEFQNNILTGVANIDRVIADKIGEGDFDGSGKELADGVFNLDGNNFSVSTFYVKDSDDTLDLFDAETFKDYFSSIAKELSSGTFSKSFLCFNKGIEEGSKFMELYKESISMLKEEIQSGIIVVSGTSLEILTKIKQQL